MAFLAHSLRENRTTRTIDVSGNCVGETLADAQFSILEDSFRSNPTLEILDLRGSGFRSEQIARLSRDRTPNDRILNPSIDAVVMNLTHLIPSPTVA
jgi:hypothetical protein